VGRTEIEFEDDAWAIIKDYIQSINQSIKALSPVQGVAKKRDM